MKAKVLGTHKNPNKALKAALHKCALASSLSTCFGVGTVLSDGRQG